MVMDGIHRNLGVALQQGGMFLNSKLKLGHVVWQKEEV